MKNAPDNRLSDGADDKVKQFLKAHKNDLLRVLALLLLAGGGWLYTLLTRRGGGVVEVAVDGTVAEVLPLSADGSYTWTGAAGTNTLVIENGAAYMVSADCPDRLCVKRGPVRYAGESIVCLPHKLTVTVTEGGAAGLDAVSG